MNREDYEGYLLSGTPIPIRDLILKPLSLRWIVLNEKRYQEVLGAIFFDVNKLDLSQTPELQQLDKFSLFSLLVAQDNEIRERVIQGLLWFLGRQFEVVEAKIVSEDLVLDEDLWKQLKTVIAWQNKIEYDPSEEPEYNPANHKALELQRKLEENKRQVAEIKKRKNQDPGLCDLVSGLSSKHPSINLLNVWDLTYYQFVDQLSRLQIVEAYEFALSSLLAGADSKKLTITHWTTKI